MEATARLAGVRGVFVWDWDQFITLACLTWRWQTAAERASGSDLRPTRLAVLEAGVPPHASTPLFDIGTGPPQETVVVPAASPFEQTAAHSRLDHRPSLADDIGLAQNDSVTTP